MFPLKILSWNVEHFDGFGGLSTRGKSREEVIAARQDRLKRVVKFLKDQDPDIFGLSEVESKDVFQRLTRQMPGYAFHVTDGDQSQELLIAVRHGIPVFFRQKDEFKRNNRYLRPAALLTVTYNRKIDIPILFTHLQSSAEPEGFGLRDAMSAKSSNSKKARQVRAKSGLRGVELHRPW